ncbi:bifunctional histidinol-phosphatase/imidazoleglycerol-phosphate dehydratase HisB [Marilutibacter chinensis]|uniref:Histidine biosynthesis bifunctional protein HisB n=1 Tax=Marilutibacter chinensis TaxID=2912247 RepID=A0ABS9HRN9_9GAMM|nr:bifunctional histidinol-phosphatase/imidazoleglycerol-phosphate dehydratase HisB [Lysobacter chinensis]MCF7220802.1 bifunctional histidinol-phosphatase/imidazoleglycerol-phosphate dehydratase HisB [Lysobacter chinensis]
MRPILFVDRDGTLIAEPPDHQIDSYEKLRFVDGVVPALLRLRDAGYQFVMVSNQDGLGTEAYPRESFEGPHALMMQLFESQGIVFREVLIDTSFPDDNALTRKPGIGLVLHYLKDRSVDWTRSAMVGDRPTDNAFARNLGIRAFQLRNGEFGGDWDWAGIAHALADAPRTAKISRNTRETRIEVEVDLDRAAEPRVSTGIGFFDHMLEQLGKHGGFALTLSCEGDLHIDEHHTVEDCALALGQALREALGDKRGIGRYGFDPSEGSGPVAGNGGGHGFTLPMDESLASVALDFSGRPYLVFEGTFRSERIGGLSAQMVPHFFRSLCETAGINLNLRVDGDNDHHQVEACFKAFARALRQAIRREGNELPSTKGLL